MRTIKVLDCTLRDGGYCNNWMFGFSGAKKILQGLTDANVDIMECGFLTDKAAYDPQVTLFNTLEQVTAIIPKDRTGKQYVVMVNYGEYDIDALPEKNCNTVDGIRIAFHKKDLVNALDLCKKVKEKGYHAFIQAMVSLSYTDEEFLDMIHKVNEIEPYAFYIVDSFGVMKRKDLIRLFYLVEHNLKSSILIGFHSHNNLQLSYSNAQALVEVQTSRDLVIDSSTLGMGRGAGNLNTELFVEYLNENEGSAYSVKPLLHIIDEVLNTFYQKEYWGYSLPNYLSAKHHAHPNYAMYLDDKKTLTIENMDEIFASMSENKKNNFDKSYFELLYTNYMMKGKINEEHLSALQEELCGKAVLLIAPGKSTEDEKDTVVQFAKRPDVFSISVNFLYPHYNTNNVFVSNLRRFREFPETAKHKAIVTSHVPGEDVYLRTPYAPLLNDVEAVRDNAGLMLIRFLINMGVKKIFLAGIDGYAHDSSQNYADKSLEFELKASLQDAMNEGMCTVLKEFNKVINIEFLTKPRYVHIN